MALPIPTAEKAAEIQAAWDAMRQAREVLVATMLPTTVADYNDAAAETHEDEGAYDALVDRDVCFVVDGTIFPLAWVDERGDLFELWAYDHEGNETCVATVPGDFALYHS